VFVTVMTVAEANKAREMSKAAREDAPWKKWPEAMYKKTALRRLSKLLPTVRDLPRDDDELIERSAAIGALTEDGGDAPALAPEQQQQQIEDKPRTGAAATLDQFASEANGKRE